MEHPFELLSFSHIGALMAIATTGAILIFLGRNKDEKGKVDLAVGAAGLVFSSVIIEFILFLSQGRFIPQTDIPLYLCDIVALSLPFVLVNRNRKWIGIFYFWALAGTLQAILTPDVQDGYPSFAFFKYFFSHGGIVIIVLYTILVWKIRITWKDYWNAVIYFQIYLVIIHIINSILNSNYSYTMSKPPGGSLLDIFGPWPWYILGGELLMFLLFLILILPFLLMKSDRWSEPVVSGLTQD